MGALASRPADLSQPMAKFRADVLAWINQDDDAAGERVHLAVAAQLVRTVVFLEGLSDLAAVEVMAAGSGLDVDHAGVCFLDIGGATNIGAFMPYFAPDALNLRLAGLVDHGEYGFFARALEREELGAGHTIKELSRLGFFVCDADLEDELIRSLGVNAVENVLAQYQDLERFRMFQAQPAQRGRPATAQLRRFMGTTSGRKIDYGAHLAQALEPHNYPAPLKGLLEFLSSPTSAAIARETY
ncbi:TOPRIM nucleotidyl transferase/hydrolase domain-containing protein [Pseudarthrobacter sp. J1738]|uniref:TOPRIM nucleotidyl transferase/hydrolase domain-containing protein n=1 Tax=unclassified Pseudarthrobacter TaxID=2647000 RepID=UPI003D29F259